MQRLCCGGAHTALQSHSIVQLEMYDDDYQALLNSLHGTTCMHLTLAEALIRPFMTFAGLFRLESACFCIFSALQPFTRQILSLTAMLPGPG